MITTTNGEIKLCVSFHSYSFHSYVSLLHTLYSVTIHCFTLCSASDDPSGSHWHQRNPTTILEYILLYRCSRTTSPGNFSAEYRIFIHPLPNGKYSATMMSVCQSVRLFASVSSTVAPYTQNDSSGTAREAASVYVSVRLHESRIQCGLYWIILAGFSYLFLC